MVDVSVLSAFIPTFFMVSLTPGLCMTLALSLGMTQGVARTAWMMGGELVGVGITAVLSVIGVAAVMLHYPAAFTVFKWGGGAYLIYLGVMMWRERGSLTMPAPEQEARLGAARHARGPGFRDRGRQSKGLGLRYRAAAGVH